MICHPVVEVEGMRNSKKHAVQDSATPAANAPAVSAVTRPTREERQVPLATAELPRELERYAEQGGVVIEAVGLGLSSLYAARAIKRSRRGGMLSAPALPRSLWRRGRTRRTRAFRRRPQTKGWHLRL